ncbi:hypothetical protein EC960939_1438, partial [Escherichia coli 96.0939]
MADSEHGGTGA